MSGVSRAEDLGGGVSGEEPREEVGLKMIIVLMCDNDADYVIEKR